MSVAFRRIRNAYFVWLFLALLAFTAITIHDFHWQNIYTYIMILGIGVPLFRYREKIGERLLRWQANRYLKMGVLLFGMVLLEETFAALANNLSEGFDFSLYLKRLRQFWTLNIFTFAGPIIAASFLYMRFRYSRVDMAVLAGMLGVFAEKIITLFPGNIIAFLIFVPLIGTIYAVIFSPAFLSIEPPSQRRALWGPLRYGLMLGAFYGAAVPFIFTITKLAERYPELIPPAHFIGG